MASAPLPVDVVDRPGAPPEHDGPRSVETGSMTGSTVPTSWRPWRTVNSELAVKTLLSAAALREPDPDRAGASQARGVGWAGPGGGELGAGVRGQRAEAFQVGGVVAQHPPEGDQVTARQRPARSRATASAPASSATSSATAPRQRASATSASPATPCAPGTTDAVARTTSRDLVL